MAKLTPKQQRFIDEYLTDLNATQAYLRAGYKVSENVAKVNASRMLTKANVQAAIKKAMDKRSERTEIKADDVLRYWHDIGTADPNEIIQLRRVNCRHCYGKDHEYQWRDEKEHEEAVALAIKNTKEGKKPVIPSEAGGYGYNALARPNAKCPYCWGEGRMEVHAEDTRYLSPKAKLLYAGVKYTQNGIEVKMRDQDKAMENVARHLGMFKDKIDLTGETTINITLVDDDGPD